MRAMGSLCPGTKDILETCIVCLHVKGSNLVKLVKEKGILWACQYWTLLQKALTMGILTKKMRMKKAKNWDSFLGMVPFWLWQDGPPWWVPCHLKACLDHHWRSNSVLWAMLVALNSTLIESGQYMKKFLNRFRFLNLLVLPLLDMKLS